MSATRLPSHSGPLTGSDRARLRDDVPERWLLLRGLGREQRHWFRFAEQLSEGLGVPCRAVDLPGVGRGRFERAPSSAALTAEALAYRLKNEREPFEGRVGVLGLSFGGMVALELCHLDPERFTHAVLVNSSSRLSPPWLRLFPRGLALITESLLVRDVYERERRIYDLTSNLGVENIARYARQAAGFAESSYVSRRAVMTQLAAATRFVPPEVWQPVLVLSSKRDRMVSSSCSMDLATHLGALHRAHETAGHDLPLDAPEWAVGCIADWLASSDARTVPPDVALRMVEDVRTSSPPPAE